MSRSRCTKKHSTVFTILSILTISSYIWSEMNIEARIAAERAAGDDGRHPDPETHGGSKYPPEDCCSPNSTAYKLMEQLTLNLQVARRTTTDPNITHKIDVLLDDFLKDGIVVEKDDVPADHEVENLYVDMGPDFDLYKGLMCYGSECMTPGYITLHSIRGMTGKEGDPEELLGDDFKNFLKEISEITRNQVLGDPSKRLLRSFTEKEHDGIKRTHNFAGRKEIARQNQTAHYR